MRANLLCKLDIKCTFSTRLPTLFQGSLLPALRSERERERETLGKNPGNEVISVVTDGLKNLLRFCSLCQVLCRKWRRREIKQATFYCTTALLSWSLGQANYWVLMRVPNSQLTTIFSAKYQLTTNFG